MKTRLNVAALTPTFYGARIESAECYDRNGAYTVNPKIVIDCSGDGDVSAKAGVPYALDDESDNMMAVAISFHMIGVDWDQVFVHPDPYFSNFVQECVAQGRLQTDPAKFYLMKGFHEGTAFCNSIHVRGVDGTEPVAVGAATQEGRWCWHQLFQFLRQDVPGFANAHISLSPPIVGVRETLKLEGGIASRSLTSRATKIADGIVSCDNLIDVTQRSEAVRSHDAAIEKGS